MTASLISLFSTAIYHSTIEVDNDIKTNIQNLEYLRVKNDNGYISKNYHLLEDSSYANLKRDILAHSKTYLFDILRIKKIYDIKLSTSWANKHDHLDFSQEHSHNNSILSGIYYTDVNEQSGDLIFTNPFANFGSSLELQLENYSQFNSNEVQLTPKNGDLFLFPSALKHKVTKNKSNSLRYSLAFNIIAKGYYGTHENELQIS